MKRMLITCLLILFVTSFLSASYACTPGAKFEIGALNISPAQVIEGNSVLASVDVTNAGKAEGTFQARLRIDNALREIKYVPMAAGEKKTISFTIDAAEAGTHSIRLNSLAGKFSVLTPPGFAELVVSPAQVRIGEQVTVSANISNTGGVSGNYTLDLKVNGLAQETKTVQVNADSTETVTFALTKNNAGTYSVNVGSLSGSFTVLIPAVFTISNLIISPQQVLQDREVSITCNVTNSGEVDDYCPVILKIDGIPVNSKNVTVSAGATEIVAFSFSNHIIGSYNVEIGDLSSTLEISEGLLPTLYVGDTWVFKEVYKGIEYTRTERIVREETMEGKASYVMQVTYDPPMDGWIYEETRWINKATHYPLFSRVSATLSASGLTMTRLIAYSREGASNRWPYQVGNEFTVKTSWIVTDFLDAESFTDRGESTVIYRCMSTEDILVEAGTFRCFKTVSYDNAQATYEYWYSDKAKTRVKTRGITNAHTIELISYSVK
ncbi:MAG TPA: CARDB domain-containing protein [Dehalococcoidia bacterium]|nr:CARDB domain-containing protein [Dehalococcoidia bacterium]